MEAQGWQSINPRQRGGLCWTIVTDQAMRESCPCPKRRFQCKHDKRLPPKFCFGWQPLIYFLKHGYINLEYAVKNRYYLLHNTCQWSLLKRVQWLTKMITIHTWMYQFKFVCGLKGLLRSLLYRTDNYCTRSTMYVRTWIVRSTYILRVHRLLYWNRSTEYGTLLLVGTVRARVDTGIYCNLTYARTYLL